jgi:hypothetical protein
MRLSGLVIVVMLSVSTLFAQHSSAGAAGGSSGSSGSSSSSSSSSSSASSGSSSSGGSHSGYSGGSSSSSSSSSSGSSHSSGGSSSVGSHGSAGGSGAASGHNSSNSTSRVGNSGSASHTSGQTAQSNNERAVREPNSDANRKMPVGKGNPPSSAKLPPGQQQNKMSQTQERATPEKRSFFSFLRHPFHPKPKQRLDVKPKETADLRHRVPPCPKEPCPVCPPGETRNGKGACVAVIASNDCQAGQTWNGGVCSPAACGAGTSWNGISCTPDASECASFDSRAAMLANEMRGTKSEIDRVCTQDPFGQRCRELTMDHDGQLLRYRGLLNEAPSHCRTTMPDPLSL